MRTFWLAPVLYLVIAFPFPNSDDVARPAQALAKSIPSTGETRGKAPGQPSDNAEPETNPSNPEPARQRDDAADPALLRAENFEKLKQALFELARPTGKPTTAEMCETLVAAALAHDLPVGFFVRLIQQESGFNPEVVSPAGAQGVAQFMPKVAEEWGLEDPFDPHQALPASARFLRSLRQQFGNWGLAAAAYNGGSGRLQKWLDKRGKLPEETRKYVLSITGIPAEKWAGDAKKVNFTIPERAPCKDIALPADFDDGGEDDFPLPRSRAAIVAEAAAPGKGKPSKIAAVTSKIAEPAAIVAAARPSKRRNPEQAHTVRVAEKSPAKSSAKTAGKNAKKPGGKGRVQVADARPSRK